MENSGPTEAGSGLSAGALTETTTETDMCTIEGMELGKIRPAVTKNVIASGITNDEDAEATVAQSLNKTPPHCSIKSLETAIVELPPGNPALPDLLEKGHRLQRKYEQQGDLKDLQQAIECTEEALLATPHDSHDRTAVFDRLGTLFDLKYQKLEALSDLDQAIKWVEAAAASMQDDPHRFRQLRRLGSLYHQRFTHSDTTEDLDKATKRTKEALEAIPHDSHDQAEIFNYLGVLFDLKYQKLEVLGDLDQAIRWVEAAAASTQGDPHRLCQLRRLGSFYSQRFAHSEAIEDLEKSTKWTEEALEAVPRDSPDKAGIFEVMSGISSVKYQHLELLDDLDNAIKWAQAAASASTQEDPHRLCKLKKLGVLHSMRYDRLNLIEDLDKAIDSIGEALATSESPTCFLRIPTVLVLLEMLHTRYHQLQSIEDIETAIKWCEEILEATPSDHPDRVRILRGIGIMLSHKYEESENIEDLEYAILWGQELVEASPPGHPGRADALNNLRKRFYNRYELLGNSTDLDETIKWAEEAITATPLDHPKRTHRLKLLFSYKFDQYGDLEDLGQAIKCAELEVAATTPGEPNRPSLLQGLGHMLGRRYKQLGYQDDLDNEIKYNEEALEGSSPGSDLWAKGLENLAISFRSRYTRSGAQQDLQQAITHIETALSVTLGDRYSRAQQLLILGMLLDDRYKRTGILGDLEQAIKLAKEALPAFPPGMERQQVLHVIHHRSYWLLDKDRGSEAMKELVQAIDLDREWDTLPLSRFDRENRQSSMINMLWSNYKNAENPEVLIELIKMTEEYIKATPLDHPERANLLNTLGRLICERYRHNNLAEDLDYSIRSSREASECKMSPPQARIMPGRNAAILLGSQGRYQEASSILEGAVQILSQLCPQFLERHDQEYILSDFTQLGAEAASLALQAEKEASHCLSLLELSRGIIMGLLINCRSDLTDLQLLHPDVFNKFNNLRTEIDSPYSPVETHGGYSGSESTYEDWRRERERAIREMEDTLTYIRTLHGFRGFHLPPSPEGLMAIANEGPIVVFNCSIFRGDAIIVTKSEIKTLPLPGLEYEEVNERMRQMAGELVRGNSKMSAFRLNNEKMEKLLLWLWDVAVEPVLEELQLTNTTIDSEGSNLSRIWWIGVGPLAMAPFHAAGDHSPNSTNNTFARAISSYTPTIKALSYAREKKLEPLNKSDVSLLLVTMPTTPGARPLNGIEKEVKDIVDEINNNSGIKRTHLAQLKHPSTTEVLDYLPSYGAVHFACHGVPDDKNPSNSHLLLLKRSASSLKSDTVDKLTAEAISNKNIKKAQLAYLSACSTAENRSKNLLDESLHIASAFQLAGFSHVLATMWESNDKACQQVATEFYRQLFNGEKGYEGHRQVSIAFHHAVKKLRDEKWRQPLLWASFIHTGP